MTRSRRLKTDNLADFLPIYAPYGGPKGGRPVCLFENTDSGLVAIDPFGRDLANYNALVTGSSGSGKSFLNNLVLFQCLAERPSVFVIDIGGSYRKLAEYFGGQYVDIAPPDGSGPCQRLNPFALGAGEVEPSPRKVKFLVAFAESLLADGGADARLGKLERSQLEEVLIGLYDRKVGGGAEPTLSMLAQRLASTKDPLLQRFAKVLFPWTGSRPYGQLLDGPGTIALSSDLVVFDLKGLSAYPDLQAVMLLIITDYVLCRIEGQSGQGDGKKKMILLDEAWELLKSEAASSFMEYCVRTLRKMGAGITFITQGLEEIVQSPIGGAILSNTATKYVLRQRGDLEPVRQILKLNEEELRLIGSLRQTKGQYAESFLIRGDDRAVIRIRPTPLEYWIATSDAYDNALIGERRRQRPEASLEDILVDLAREFPRGKEGS